MILLWPAYNLKRGRKKNMDAVHTLQEELLFFRGDITFFFLKQRERWAKFLNYDFKKNLSQGSRMTR